MSQPRTVCSFSFSALSAALLSGAAHALPAQYAVTPIFPPGSFDSFNRVFSDFNTWGQVLTLNWSSYLPELTDGADTYSYPIQSDSTVVDATNAYGALKVNDVGAIAYARIKLFSPFSILGVVLDTPDAIGNVTREYKMATGAAPLSETPTPGFENPSAYDFPAFIESLDLFGGDVAFTHGAANLTDYGVYFVDGSSNTVTQLWSGTDRAFEVSIGPLPEGQISPPGVSPINVAFHTGGIESTVWLYESSKADSAVPIFTKPIVYDIDYATDEVFISAFDGIYAASETESRKLAAAEDFGGSPQYIDANAEGEYLFGVGAQAGAANYISTQAIYTGPDPVADALIKVGDEVQIPGEPQPRVVSSLGRAVLNERGQIAAQVDFATASPGVFESAILRLDPPGTIPDNPEALDPCNGGPGFCLPRRPRYAGPFYGHSSAEPPPFFWYPAQYSSPFAIGFNFEAEDELLRFAGVEVPFPYGDGSFDLFLFDEETGQYYDSGVDILSGQYFSFVADLNQPEGLSRFSVLGIEPQAMTEAAGPMAASRFAPMEVEAVTSLDQDAPSRFVFGLTFASLGDDGFRMIPVELNDGNQLPVAACKAVTLAADAQCAGNASVDNGSSDPDGDAITIEQEPTGPYTLGATSVNLTVTDGGGASASCTAVVTVVDTTPPVLTPPPAVTAECTGTQGATVDPGRPPVSDACDGTPTVVSDAPALFPVGTTIVTWSATDAYGNKATATQEVTITEGAACKTTGRICSFLGNDSKPSLLDQDIFEFPGQAGDTIAITLEKDTSGTTIGERAALILKEKGKLSILKIDRSDLPNRVDIALPKASTYQVIVGEEPKILGGKQFRGNYCLTLDAPKAARETFKPTASVE